MMKCTNLKSTFAFFFVVIQWNIFNNTKKSILSNNMGEYRKHYDE